MSLPELCLSDGTTDALIRDSLETGSGRAELTVTGSCMEPALLPGSRISLRRPAAQPRAGDVVLVRTVRGLRLHRVVFSSRSRLRTKGDRGRYLDPLGSPSDVLAVWESDESRPRAAWRVGLSLVRLFGRPWHAFDRIGRPK